MSFWINDRLGIAYDVNEGGTRLWDAKLKDFCKAVSSEERRIVTRYADIRPCSEDEAFAYMEAKDNAQQAHTP